MTPQPPAPVGVSETMKALVLQYGANNYYHHDDKAFRFQEDLLTAIAALEAQVPQWQPIETVPKDKFVLLIHGMGRYVVAEFVTRLGRWIAFNSTSPDTLWLDGFPPSHWMPLPPSPTGP